MWYLQQQRPKHVALSTTKNIYCHETSLDLTGPQETIDTPKKDNSTTEGFIESVMKPKRSKTFDMEWHWLRDK